MAFANDVRQRENVKSQICTFELKQNAEKGNLSSWMGDMKITAQAIILILIMTNVSLRVTIMTTSWQIAASKRKFWPCIIP